jgi:hypothetical protein
MSTVVDLMSSATITAGVGMAYAMFIFVLVPQLFEQPSFLPPGAEGREGYGASCRGSRLPREDRPRGLTRGCPDTIYWKVMPAVRISAGRHRRVTA